jgi:hypothetical protein
MISLATKKPPLGLAQPRLYAVYSGVGRRSAIAREPPRLGYAGRPAGMALLVRVSSLRSHGFLCSLSLPGVIRRGARSRWGIRRQSAHPMRHVSNRVATAARASCDQVGDDKKEYEAGLHRFSSKPSGPASLLTARRAMTIPSAKTEPRKDSWRKPACRLCEYGRLSRSFAEVRNHQSQCDLTPCAERTCPATSENRACQAIDN